MAALGAATVTQQDVANVLVGFLAIAGTFLVGKIAVESILEARRKHFDAKGEPLEAIKAKETTVDGIIKVAVMGYSLWTLQDEVPELLKQVGSVFR